MFADNGRISHRQAVRQMMLTLLGPFFWLLSGRGAMGGYAELVGILLGGLGLMCWIFFLVRLENVYHHLDAFVGAAAGSLIRLIYFSYLLLAGGCLLERMTDLSGSYLLEGVGKEWLGFLILLAVFLGMNGKVQKRARLAEALYPWVFWSVVLLLFFALGQVRWDAYVQSAKQMQEEAKSSGGTIVWKKIGKGVLETLQVGIIVGFLPFLLPKVERNKSVVKPLRRGIGKLLLLVLGFGVILMGTLGTEGAAKRQDPVLLLMSGTNLPGGFLERFDVIWMAVLLCALLFSLGSLLFYGDLTQKRGIARLLLGAGIWLLAFGSGGRYQLQALYEDAVRYLYLPVFLGLTVILTIAGRMQKKGE
ncbi:MAG: GerAB/ArcD/ProY family transporter [Fusicatenibacter sp.]|nr:GerAB/ArcD/ProY family transporter [Fusicatenibacter sp.]